MKFPLLYIAFVLTACSAQRTVSGEQVWIPSELNAKKLEMDGRTVLLRGFVVYEAGGFAVWNDEKTLLEENISTCLSLISTSSPGNDLAASNRKMATLRGVFKEDLTLQGVVYLGLCNYSGIAVGEVIK